MKYLVTELPLFPEDCPFCDRQWRDGWYEECKLTYDECEMYKNEWECPGFKVPLSERGNE